MCIVGCLVAFLAFTHYLPVILPPQLWEPKMYPDVANVPHQIAPQLRTTALEKEKAMVPHSTTLAWEIPWSEEPGRLQSMGSLSGTNSLSFFTFMHWRRIWQPTPVFLPGESQGRGSLVGCCLWGRTESDTTEAT